MRPKKTILCVAADEQRLSCRVFLLGTNGYRVLRAASAEDALDILAMAEPRSIRCLVTDLELTPAMNGNELVRQAQRMHPEMRTLAISDTVSSHEASTAAEVFLPKSVSQPASLLERVHMLSIRKHTSVQVGVANLAAIQVKAAYLNAAERVCA